MSVKIVTGSGAITLDDKLVEDLQVEGLAFSARVPRGVYPMGSYLDLLGVNITVLNSQGGLLWEGGCVAEFDIASDSISLYGDLAQDDGTDIIPTLAMDVLADIASTREKWSNDLFIAVPLVYGAPRMTVGRGSGADIETPTVPAPAVWRSDTYDGVGVPTYGRLLSANLLTFSTVRLFEGENASEDVPVLAEYWSWRVAAPNARVPSDGILAKKAAYHAALTGAGMSSALADEVTKAEYAAQLVPAEQGWWAAPDGVAPARLGAVLDDLLERAGGDRTSVLELPPAIQSLPVDTWIGDSTLREALEALGEDYGFIVQPGLYGTKVVANRIIWNPSNALTLTPPLREGPLAVTRESDVATGSIYYGGVSGGEPIRLASVVLGGAGDSGNTRVSVPTAYSSGTAEAVGREKFVSMTTAYARWEVTFTVIGLPYLTIGQSVVFPDGAYFPGGVIEGMVYSTDEVTLRLAYPVVP
jgi:hypothetical protein